MKIMGIDPGKTIGLCFFRQHNYVSGTEAFSVEEVIKYIKEIRPDQIVMEAFIVGPRPSESNIPIEQIGVIKYYCNKHDIPLQVQSPSCQRFGKRQIERFHPSPHIMSACYHVIYFLHDHHIWNERRRS